MVGVVAAVLLAAQSAAIIGTILWTETGPDTFVMGIVVIIGGIVYLRELYRRARPERRKEGMQAAVLVGGLVGACGVGWMTDQGRITGAAGLAVATVVLAAIVVFGIRWSTPPSGGGPRVLVLGPIELVGCRGTKPRPSRQPRLIEMAAAVALRPGTDSHTLSALLWPFHGIRSDTFHTTAFRLRLWLGHTDDGQPVLTRDDGLGWVFESACPTDWHQWQALLPDGPHVATTGQLKQALRLVRGRPFEDVPRLRYLWADRIADDMARQINDARDELDLRVRTRGGKAR